MIQNTTHFIDLLPAAHINAPHPSYVAVQPITIGRETRSSIFNHPPAAITYPAIKLGENATLEFGYGIKQACWKFIQSKIYFYICINDQNGKEKVLFKATLKPSSRKKDRCWKKHQIDLSRYSGQTVSMTFKTLTKWGQSTEWCWSGWSDPTLSHTIEAPPIQPPKAKQPLVLLITADALRADYLGCYGHSQVQTPNIDQLTKDSALFTHARTQSPCTLGSYASMLTGVFPNKHGINGEWGIFPKKYQSLPQYLQTNGFQTIFAPSEEELYRPVRGVSALFDELIPSMGNPSQEGAITTRQVIKRFVKGFDEPTFMWVQYFDTHPPNTPGEPFSSLYYQGDPTSPDRTYQKQKVLDIRGMESCLEIKKSFEMMNEGITPHGLYERMRSTARVFRGEDADGADFADHIMGLGPSAYMDMTRHDFGVWLDQESENLLQCKLSPHFEKWLLETLEKLNIIESEIISWLDGVVDYRYPLSQYMASVTYFDHQVGKLITTLKELGLYDQTTIIITSPHGELLGEYENPFHHHLLVEEVLRVPMIIKPPGNYSGKRIGGMFDTIDLFPTIAEALELPPPREIDGSSRWKNVVGGKDIPPHDSFAVNYCETMGAVVRDSFIYLEAYKDYYTSSEYKWKAGEKRLYSLKDSSKYQHDLIEQYPDLAQSMALSLYENTLSHAPVLS